jgi:nitrate/nitrite transport system ATP-binding protein
MNPEKYVSVEGVGMIFESKKGTFDALTGIDLSMRKGEFVTLIGHSGCGKTTLLNLVAGLLKPTAGALLAVERVFKDRLKERTHEALELVGLSHAEHKYPHEISGGMKQRVGIARALAIEPKVLLLDEPFGALDALTRATLQDELMRIVATTGATVVMVTHDVDEAVLLSDRVVMMTNGPAARIGDILHVALPRPRERLALAHDARFMELRAAVLEFLYEKQAHKAKLKVA